MNHRTPVQLGFGFTANRLATALILPLTLCLISTPAPGAAVSFKVDTNQSIVTLSGSAAGIVFAPQGAGSLTTRFLGTIQAEVTDTTISFPGGSVVAAMTNGNWQPLPGGGAGSAPANYGIKVSSGFIVNGNAAIRNVALDITNQSLPLSNGTFPALGLSFSYRTNPPAEIDFKYSGLIGSGSGSNILSGVSTNQNTTNATLVVQGTNLLMTIPIALTGYGTLLNSNDVVFQLTGQVVALAPVPDTTPPVALAFTALSQSPGQIVFTLATTPGQSFTILGSTNLIDWPVVVDQFTATSNPTVRIVNHAALLPVEYFRGRQN